MAFVMICGAALFFRAHAGHPVLPRSGTTDSGWWNWWDQRNYLLSAQALSRLDFTAARHWYEPAYAALAAPFAGLTPADPFLLPDLAAYLASCWLFGRVAARLLGIGPWGRLLGTTIFVFATMASKLASDIWVVPWSTTPVVPLVLGGLLATLSFAERPRPLTCFIAASCAGAIAAFRPAEIEVLTGPAALYMLWALVRRRHGVRDSIAIIGAGLAGGIIPIAAAVVFHLSIWGWQLGPYLEQSRATGFEWSLVPLRWALIVVGPEPLLTDGLGLARRFPWIIPGVAGIAACLVAPGRQGRAPHVLILGIATSACVMLLAYRDLHPTGLWRYSNYHYFKWLIPLFALYAVLLAQSLVFRPERGRALIGAVLAAIGLFCWRPVLDTTAPPFGVVATGSAGLTLPAGMGSVSDAVLVTASGTRDSIEGSTYYAAGPDRQYVAFQDFRAYARPGGFLFVPLRTLPQGLSITFPDSIALDSRTPPIAATQRIAFGLPCWRATCISGPGP